jgi:hypothetical protein
MHVIVLAEHSPGDKQKVFDFIHNIKVKNKWGEINQPCVREVSVMDITVDESCVDQMLEYFPIASGHVDSKKMEFMKKMACKLTPLEYKDTSKIKRRKVNTGFPKQCYAYFQVMGVLPDNKNEEGRDMV